jgi:GNAT superfamily N-acetyltransferase
VSSAETPVSVRPVERRRDLKRFIEYPFAHYRHDPVWVPPLLVSEWERFDRTKHPFFEHARMELFLAEQAGEIVGRVAAIDDDNHNATHGDNLIFFGFFEAKSQAVAAALLAEVERWGKALGRNAVRGPANPSMNDGAGFQLDSYDESPFIMMPYNPPEYPRYVEAAGYDKVKDLYAWMIDIESGVTERLHRLAERVRKRYRPTVRQVDLKRFDEELAKVKRLYNEAWEENWGFVKYTDAEFAHLAKELRLIVEPSSVLFLELDGETAGLALGLPDINQVLKRIRGRLLPFGIVKLLMRRRYITQGRLPILGLMPEYRNKGLELVLIDEIAQRGRKLGYKRGECSWVLEDNHAMNHGIEAAGLTRYKTYRLYQKAIG